MSTLKVYSDLLMSQAALEELKAGIAPHELVLPLKPALSVLSKSEPGPAFKTVDIAFGQPDISSIYEAKNLKWVQVSSAGFTRYDTDEFRAYAKENGVKLSNSSSVYMEPCAEHVVSFMLCQSRKLMEAVKLRVANGTEEWNAMRSRSNLLQGQKVVILGFGTIAERVVEMLAPFKMEIVAMRRKARGDEGVRVVDEAGLPAELANADHVINILPENDASIGFFDAARFAQLKKGSVFYNIGRGSTVNQEALYETLNSGHLEAAWLDVTSPEPLPDDHPLWTLSNCYITPHTAGGHAHEDLSLVRHFLRNFKRHLAGEALNDSVIA